MHHLERRGLEQRRCLARKFYRHGLGGACTEYLPIDAIALQKGPFALCRHQNCRTGGAVNFADIGDAAIDQIGRDRSYPKSPPGVGGGCRQGNRGSAGDIYAKGAITRDDGVRRRVYKGRDASPGPYRHTLGNDQPIVGSGIALQNRPCASYGRKYRALSSATAKRSYIVTDAQEELRLIVTDIDGSSRKDRK